MGPSQRGAHVEETLNRARESFERSAWSAAFTMLVGLDADVLEIDDLERLAVAAYLTGNDEQSDDAWMRAHEQAFTGGDHPTAARCAFWLGFNLLLRGDMARSGGWLGRARTLLEEGGHETAVEGFLLVVEGVEHLDGGDPRSAYAAFERAGVIGKRLNDRDVMALALLGRGEALIAQADLVKGTACLDEAMVSVIANEVSAPVAGIVYCAVLLECRNIFDARRAQEWTEALTQWCRAQPDLVPYRGQCLVHRSEILQLQGKWHDALDEARRACLQLAGHPAIGEAYYQQAEMHRLQGAYDQADAAYRSASTFGREPQPGLSLLRLAQGDNTAAVASIRRVVAEAQTQTRRSRVLPALAEIALAAGDREAARSAADELASIASAVDAPQLVAIADHALGAVLVAEGDLQSALHVLRGALDIWLRLGAPYESARERTLIAVVCRELGDEETALRELEQARTVFESLGAEPALATVDGLASPKSLPAGLTARQAEVLKLVTAGLSNHDIAVELGVSDHTVRRHLQNIFAKVGVSSRTAATAFAFEHGLT